MTSTSAAIRRHTTVVVPAVDEEPTIGGVISGCLESVDRVLVVAGTCRDGTVEEARRAGATEVLFDHGRGKGDALRVALDRISTEIVAFVDADGSHDPRQLPLLVTPILEGRADHVGGSRLIGGSSEFHGGFDEFLRLTGSAFITACINRTYGERLSDSQNGFRAIRTAVVRELGLRSNGTTIEQEMIMKTLQRGYRIVEVATHEHARLHGVSKIRVLRATPAYGWSLLSGVIAGWLSRRRRSRHAHAGTERR